MGKYMRKAKTASEVAVMEVSQSSLGVRTRAKTQSLQKATAAAASGSGGSGSYLQQRNSRACLKKEKGSSKTNEKLVGEEKEIAAVVVEEEDNDKDLKIEASFGEKVLDCEAKESLIRDPEIIRIPGSSNRPAILMQDSEALIATWRLIPTLCELDKFFADTEEEQQRQFIEKYNYDPVNDKPLPGRFEWQKVDP